MNVKLCPMCQEEVRMRLDGNFPVHGECRASKLSPSEVDTILNTFDHWGPSWETTRMVLVDNADSLSLTTHLHGNSMDIEMDVRIAPEDFQRFYDRITSMAQERGWLK